MRITTWFPVPYGAEQDLRLIGPAKVLGFFIMNSAPNVLIEHEEWMHQDTFDEIVTVKIQLSGPVPDDENYQFGGVQPYSENQGYATPLVMYWKSASGV